MRKALLWWGLSLGLGALGCEADFSHPPVARLQLSPDYVREGDAFITTVMLSGKTSADPFDDPQGRVKLGFRWTLPEGARIESGTVTGPELTIRLAGDRPAAVTLEVTDGDGVTASATRVVGIFKP
jgi:hypothetical protein